MTAEATIKLPPTERIAVKAKDAAALGGVNHCRSVMNDDFARLMAQPRLCRSCGRICNGVRCRQCYSVVGRLTKILKEAGRPMSEEEISKHFEIESVLRQLESEHGVHETPLGWTLGRHPEQLKLLEAWSKRRLAA